MTDPFKQRLIYITLLFAGWFIGVLCMRRCSLCQTPVVKKWWCFWGKSNEKK